MNFEKPQKQFQSFHEEIESLLIQLREMSRSFSQNEERIKSDLTQLRGKFNFEVNEMYTKIRESEDRFRSEHELVQNHIDALSPGDVKQNVFDDNMLIEKTKSVSNQDETTNDNKTLEKSSKNSIIKCPGKPLKKDESIKKSCDLIDVMPDMSTKKISSDGELACDIELETKQSTFSLSNELHVANNGGKNEGGNGEQIKVSLQTQHVVDPCESRPSLVTCHEVSRENRERLVTGMLFCKTNSQTQRDVQDDQDDEPYRSNSFHMYAVGTLTDSTKSNRCGWLVTLVSLAFTFMQLVVLNTVVNESSHPTCSSHDECRKGEYCDNTTDWKGGARCEDCYYAPPGIDNCPAVLSTLLDYGHPEYVDVDHTKLAYGVNSDNFSKIEHDCLVQLHCDETDTMSDKCDFLLLNRAKWHATQQIVFIFMSMLFATIICTDVQDAIAEETYMDIGLKNGLLGPSKRMAAEILRIALRCRQMILPWYATSAAIAIIINDPLTAKNILLNLLTIEVILIADDMFAVLVLPLLHQDSTNALVKHAAEEDVKISYIWSRVQSIAVTLSLVIIVYTFDSLLDNFEQKHNMTQTCSHIAGFLEVLVNFIIPFIACTLHGLVVTIFSNTRNMMKKAMLGIGELLIDVASWTLGILGWTIIIVSSRPLEEYEVIGLPILLSYLALYLGSQFLRVYYSWEPFQSIHEA